MTTLVQGALMDLGPGKPLYSELMICADCGGNLGYFSPHAGGAEGQRWAVAQAHREKMGCRGGRGFAPRMIVFCSLCPGAVVAQRTLSMKGGRWWSEIGHLHDELHHISRQRVRQSRADVAIVAEPAMACALVSEVLPFSQTLDGEITSPCRTCGAPMVWRMTKSGSWCPMDVVEGRATARSHMATCQDVKERLIERGRVHKLQGAGDDAE